MRTNIMTITKQHKPCFQPQPKKACGFFCDAKFNRTSILSILNSKSET